MKTIHLVDDSPTILMSLHDILTKGGHKVEQSKNGQEALQRFKSGYKPDLIITDINMPGMSGIDLVKEIRKLPAYRFVPILVLTTESQASKRSEGKAAGATGWLVKPVAGSDLLNAIKQVLPGA
ncbi:two-component system, chemotaxis family, chemotaxis protein CheY [Gammaproteobacteria bacterium]